MYETKPAKGNTKTYEPWPRRGCRFYPLVPLHWKSEKRAGTGLDWDDVELPASLVYSLPQ